MWPEHSPARDPTSDSVSSCRPCFIALLQSSNATAAILKHPTETAKHEHAVARLPYYPHTPASSTLASAPTRPHLTVSHKTCAATCKSVPTSVQAHSGATICCCRCCCCCGGAPPMLESKASNNNNLLVGCGGWGEGATQAGSPTQHNVFVHTRTKACGKATMLYTKCALRNRVCCGNCWSKPSRQEVRKLQARARRVRHPPAVAPSDEGGPAVAAQEVSPAAHCLVDFG
jgi:hypothetical protein